MFDPVKHGPRLVADCADALKRLRGGAAPEEVGEPGGYGEDDIPF